MDVADHGIGARLRHGLGAELVALGGRFVAIDGEMNRGLLEARQLKAAIEVGLRVLVTQGGLLVLLMEMRDHGGAAFRRLDRHDAPGLAVADRGGVIGEIKQSVEPFGLDRIGAKTPDVAPPAQQRFKREQG